MLAPLDCGLPQTGETAQLGVAHAASTSSTSGTRAAARPSRRCGPRSRRLAISILLPQRELRSLDALRERLGANTSPPGRDAQFALLRCRQVPVLDPKKKVPGVSEPEGRAPSKSKTLQNAALATSA